MNDQDKLKLRQQLALYTDQFITLSDNPAWLELVQQYPELETARQAAVNTSDNLWYTFRSKCTP